MRHENCIECESPLPTYRSNRMMRCHSCADKRNKEYTRAYKQVQIEVKCPICSKVEIRTRSKRLCNQCYHKVNYVPKPRKKKIEMKKCRYEECDKMIPKDNKRVNYCRGTDCYKKQNQLEARRKRAKDKENRTPIMLKCALDSCNETFEKKGAQKFHSEECKDIHHAIRTKERIKQETEIYKMSKNKDIDLSRFTRRGKIHYEGLGNI